MKCDVARGNTLDAAESPAKSFAMHHRAALDSNALTFFVEAMRTGYGSGTENDAVAREGTAVLRAYLYAGHIFTLLPTAVKEYRQIADAQRLAFFEQVAAVLLLDAVPKPSALDVEVRVREFQQYHGGVDDCRLLAEADSMGIPHLLTFDHRFRRALESRAQRTRLLSPSEYWDSLGIRAGAEPKLSPHSSNPLSRESWWRI
jgi:hypothetical protein